MLTDIFAQRYKDRSIWTTLGAAEIALLTQCFRVVREQLIPTENYKGDTWVEHLAMWKELESKVSMELGLEQLSPHSYNFMSGAEHVYGNIGIDSVVRTWMLRPFGEDPNPDPDWHMKVRMSFIELAFRDKGASVEAFRAQTEKKIADAKTFARQRQLRSLRTLGVDIEDVGAQERAICDAGEERFRKYVEEVNHRFRQAGAALALHNGYIQIASDELIEAQVATPFWQLVADPRFVNVDIDMKEAVDRREAGDRDPAFYAAKALESAIKIVSNEKGWTRGSEKSASNYIDNLQSAANGSYIAAWEADALRNIFAKVRNELGHGPGGETMPELSQQQTNWAIESAMSWTKSLVERM